MYTNPSGSLYNFDSDIKGYLEARKEFGSMGLSNIKEYTMKELQERQLLSIPEMEIK